MSKTTAPDMSAETIDVLDSFNYVEVAQADLRPGMLLVDRDLGTPVYLLDHRQARTSTRSAGGRWYVFSYEANTWENVTLAVDGTFPAATDRVEW